MGPLTESQRSFLKLLARSKDVGEGWRQVSDHLWEHLSPTAASLPELVELDWTGKRVRLTRDGSLVLGYI